MQTSTQQPKSTASGNATFTWRPEVSEVAAILLGVVVGIALALAGVYLGRKQ